jgi:ectoine hydroxylase-related dioxygenase (phytanoyl-CoA dioxygenase family)
MFTQTEHDHFALHGLIKRSGFLPPAQLARAREAIFQQAENAGIWKDGQWHLAQQEFHAGLAAGMALVKPLNRHPAIVALAGGATQAAALALAAAHPMTPMTVQPGLLCTFPNASTWSLPHQNWHTDFPRPAESVLPGVQIFAILDDLEPQGGGTLAVTGSHRLLNDEGRISSSDLRKRLKREPYFAELMSSGSSDRSRLMREPGRIGDVELSVVEMTGKAGDVYFMDLRMLHNIAPNARPKPRLMLTQRYVLDHARGESSVMMPIV